MKRRHSLERAVKEARRIRHNLQRSRHWKPLDLMGACGLASILLSIAVNDVGILRYGSAGKWRGGHVWAMIGDTIVDITASQFNRSEFGKSDPVRGVLITKTPRSYHPAPELVGKKAYLMIINTKWYAKKDYQNWEQISEYWL